MNGCNSGISVHTLRKIKGVKGDCSLCDYLTNPSPIVPIQLLS